MSQFFTIQQSNENGIPCISRFGFSLAVVNKASRKDEKIEFQSKAITWHDSLFRSISFEYRDAITLSIRYISNGKQPVHCLFIVSVNGNGNEELAHLVADIQADLAPLFSDLAEKDNFPYLFQEIKSPALLEQPFVVGKNLSRTVFFRKPVKLYNPANLGFTSSVDQLPSAASGFLFPFDETWLGDISLFSALSGRDYYTKVCVELKPVLLDEPDISLIKQVIRNPNLLSGNLPDSEIPVYIKQLKKFIATRNDKFSISVTLLFEGTSPEQYLKSAIHRYFFGANSKIGQKTFTESVFKTGNDIQAFPLGFVYSIHTAVQAFRLPLPSENVIPGLKLEDFVFHHLPDSLASKGLLIGRKALVSDSADIRLDTNALSRHLYILGQTGTGKSTLLKTMIRDCIAKDYGFTVIDPHGDLFGEVMQLIPESKRKHLRIIDPVDSVHSWGINPLDYNPLDPSAKSLVINELLRIISSLYDMKIAGGPIFEMYFKNGLLLIMNDQVKSAFGSLSLQDFCRIFFDDEYRKQLLGVCDEEEVNRFFQKAVQMSGEQAFSNFAIYITSKITRFVDDYYLKPVVTDELDTVDFRRLIEKENILLVRMDKGRIGADNTSLLGQLVLSQLFMAGMGRTGLAPELRKPYYIFIDEFQNFMRGDAGMALAEMRKYGLSLVLANQTLGQLDNFMVESVLGNVGNMIFFRPGINDYQRIQHYLEPDFNRQDVLRLPNFHGIGRLMVENMPAESFVFQTIMEP